MALSPSPAKSTQLYSRITPIKLGVTTLPINSIQLNSKTFYQSNKRPCCGVGLNEAKNISIQNDLHFVLGQTIDCEPLIYLCVLAFECLSFAVVSVDWSQDESDGKTDCWAIIEEVCTCQKKTQQLKMSHSGLYKPIAASFSRLFSFSSESEELSVKVLDLFVRNMMVSMGWNPALEADISGPSIPLPRKCNRNYRVTIVLCRSFQKQILSTNVTAEFDYFQLVGLDITASKKPECSSSTEHAAVIVFSIQAHLGNSKSINCFSQTKRKWGAVLLHSSRNGI